MTGLAIEAVSSATAVRASHDDPPPQSSFTGTPSAVVAGAAT